MGGWGRGGEGFYERDEMDGWMTDGWNDMHDLRLRVLFIAERKKLKMGFTARQMGASTGMTGGRR